MRAAQKLYTNMTVNIKIRNTLTSDILITSGLKKCSCMAPMLFKLYLNEALLTWGRECNMGISIGGNRLFTLHFTDDQAI